MANLIFIFIAYISITQQNFTLKKNLLKYIQCIYRHEKDSFFSRYEEEKYFGKGQKVNCWYNLNYPKNY